MQDLGTLPGWWGRYYEANAVSTVGSVVVGRAADEGENTRAFRWTATGGMQDLGALPGSKDAVAYGISADGSIIVGMSYNLPAGLGAAFRWTASGGMQNLGILPGGEFSSAAYGVSADGTVVAGVSGSYGSHAFRWSAAEGVQDLGAPPGGMAPKAYGVSADGSVIVGYSYFGTTNRAVRWGGDTDGDGLPDCWETGGIPYKTLSGADARYWLPDADPLRKDIYVEVDAMFGVPISATSLAAVRAAFDAAPVPAPPGVPGGRPGIALHTEIDEQIPFDSIFDSAQMSTYREQYFGKNDETERKSQDNAAILEAKAKAYRYCLFANRMTGSRGHLLGKATGIPGTTFGVSLGGLPWSAAEIERYLGSTFMHELGHTLGLCHGGADHLHYKPNYISVMNYNYNELYKFSGSTPARLPLDYSREALSALSEACLDETRGVSGSALHTGVSVPFAHAGPAGRVADRLIVGHGPVDWNGDGSIGSYVPEDITWFPAGHPFAGDPTPGDPLNGFMDWPALKYAVPPPVPLQLTCAGTAQICQLTEELVIWHREHLPPPKPPCPADCDLSGQLDVLDFACFQNAYALGDKSKADVGGGPPGPGGGCTADGQLTIADFVCFQNLYALGCP